MERAFTACCCILRDTVLIRFTIFQYHVKANKLLVHTYPRRLVSTYLHNTQSQHSPPGLYFTPSTEYIVSQTDVFRLAYWFIFFLNVSLCSQSTVSTDISVNQFSRSPLSFLSTLSSCWGTIQEYMYSNGVIEPRDPPASTLWNNGRNRVSLFMGFKF